MKTLLLFICMMIICSPYAKACDEDDFTVICNWADSCMSTGESINCCK